MANVHFWMLWLPWIVSIAFGASARAFTTLPTPPPLRQHGQCFRRGPNLPEARRYSLPSQWVISMHLSSASADLPEERFQRTAPASSEAESPCLITIDDTRYNLTAWAKAHPGGVDVLKRFHGKDATEAFHAAGHSEKAHEMLERFAICKDDASSPSAMMVEGSAMSRSGSALAVEPRWKTKLFTKEDPKGLHKILGLFVLFHFAFRFYQMLFVDASAGFGSRRGKGPSLVAPSCLILHSLLSLSSLIFRTVPRERVVGKPMIWQEFRVHNIVFAMRSVATTFLAWLSIYVGHAPRWRRVAVAGSCLVTLLASWAADLGTKRLRPSDLESTTATMPYWEGCPLNTQRRIKTFYAFSQFQATATCMAVGNPAWSFSLLLPIQLASFLMTLVRKGIITSGAYHAAYSISLFLPYLVGLRSMSYMNNVDFPLFLTASWILFQLRRQGINKYTLWISFAIARTAFGDRVLDYARCW